MKEQSTEKYNDLLKNLGIKKNAVIGNSTGRPVYFPPPTRGSFKAKPTNIKRGCKGCSRKRRSR